MKNDSFAIKYILADIKNAHTYFQQTMEGVTNEVAHYRPAGKANPIAGIYAHLIFSEDFFLHFFLQKKSPLFDSSWKGKTGISENQPTEWETAYPQWLKSVKIDIPGVYEYAKAYFQIQKNI